MESALNVGIVGFGNIGTGVMKALNQNGALINSRLPRSVAVTRIADLDTSTPRDCEYDPAIISDDVEGLLDASDIQVVVELTGTMDFARQLVVKALKNGKHVVTANKALLAVHGRELIQTALDNNVCLLFEAAVGGGIPLIRTLHQGLAANDIEALRGIINGTANYILTQMTLDPDLEFGVALAEAQRLGYAEPDPTFDVEGQDTAHKLAILATLCFGQDITFDDVFREGISRIQAIDIAYAKELGYAVKLLGIARHHADGIEVRVHPTLIPNRSRLAHVNDVYNALRVDGNLTGSVILSGRGAGASPTASAVVSDLMALASGEAEGGLMREMRLCMPAEEKNLRPMDDLETAYYIRFGLLDKPGALAQVMNALGDHGVSVASIKQPYRQEDENGHADVLVMTHEAREADLRKALEEISGLYVNRTEPFVLYVEDMDE